MKHYLPPVIPLVPPKLYSRMAWACKLALAPVKPSEEIRDCVVDPEQVLTGMVFTVNGVGPDEYGDMVINGVCADGTPSTPVRLQLWRAVAPPITNSEPAAEMSGATKGTT